MLYLTPFYFTIQKIKFYYKFFSDLTRDYTCRWTLVLLYLFIFIITRVEVFNTPFKLLSS